MVSELFNPFLANAPILYPLEKKNRKRRVFLVFSECVKWEHWQMAFAPFSMNRIRLNITASF